MEEVARADAAMFAEAFEAAATDSKGKGKKEKMMKEPAPYKTVAPEETLIPPVDDADVKAGLLRKIAAYEREFSDRLDGVKVPKTFGAKASVEELKVRLADIEHELGKSGAMDYVRQGFVHMCKAIEGFQERSHVLPYNLKNFGDAAVVSVNTYQLPDGSVQVGHMLPLLKEFSIKYSDWFSSRVEMRILVAMAGMMAEVHRINEQAPEVAKKATKKTSNAAAAKGL